jgi:hypothetical protein
VSDSILIFVRNMFYRYPKLADLNPHFYIKKILSETILISHNLSNEDMDGSKIIYIFSIHLKTYLLHDIYTKTREVN